MRRPENSQHVEDRCTVLLRSAFPKMRTRAGAGGAVEDGLVRAWLDRKFLDDEAEVLASPQRAVARSFTVMPRSEIPRRGRGAARILRSPAGHVSGPDRSC